MPKIESTITTDYNKKKLKRLIKDDWLTRKELAEEMFLTVDQVTRVISALRYEGTPITSRKSRVGSSMVSQYKLATSDDVAVLMHKEGRSNNRDNLIMIAVLNRIIEMCATKEPHQIIQKHATHALQSCGIVKELDSK